MRFLSPLLGCLSLLACLDAAAQFSEANCPAEILAVAPNASCVVRSNFSYLIFGSMPASTPAQACSIAATILTQASNIATACQFDALQSSCNCAEEGSGISSSWTVAENPDSLLPACPTDFTVSPRLRLPLTSVDGFRTMMPVCIGAAKNPLLPPLPPLPVVSPPASPPSPMPVACPVTALREMTDPLALQHEHGKFSAVSDHARLTAATAAGQACMLARVDAASVFPVAAYRPPEFQAHLKELWDKWQGLSKDASAACKPLKDNLRREWLKHKLVRDPQAHSPHTTGEAIDITGFSEHNVDAVAAYCGMLRPDPAASPLHFQPGRK